MEPVKEPEPEEQGDASTYGSSSDEEIMPQSTKEVDNENGCSDASESVPGPESKKGDLQDGPAYEDVPAERKAEDEETEEGPSCNSESRRPSWESESEEDAAEENEEPSPCFLTPAKNLEVGGLRHRWWPRRNHTKDENQPGDNEIGLTDDSGAVAATGCSSEDLNADSSQRWALVDNKGEVVAEDDGMPLTTGSVEAKIEQLLTWMLAPAVRGISTLGVPGAVDRADELLASVPGRDVESAVREVVAGSERTVNALVANFCLERIPFLGCPTALLKNTWGSLRSILIIAALYGHDLEKPRTHHEALLCLVPPGEECTSHRRTGTAYTLTAGFNRDAETSACGSPLVTETAHKVARMMIKGAMRRATGLQAAADCFELASLLYNHCMHESVDEDGYVCVAATPASAARDFFRRKSRASSAMLWFSLPLLLMGGVAPQLFVVARLVPMTLTAVQELGRVPRCVPAILLALPAFPLLLHALSTAGGKRFRKCDPVRIWRRIAYGREARMLQDASPKIITMLVFSLHALLPAFTAYSAVSMVLESVWMACFQSFPGWDRLHGLACMMLGLYSLCTCVTQYLKSEKEEAISGDNKSRCFCTIFRFFSASWALTRACCILAAWMYALLALDLVATNIETWSALGTEGQSTSTLGIIGPLAWLLRAPADGNPLWNEKALTFSLRIISVSCQQRLIVVLSRREVLLRLIGAEHITAQTVCLLLKGVAFACSESISANPIQEFFEMVTPPPVCCVIVVAARAQAVVLGSMLAITPRLTSSGSIGNAASFACGLLGGAYAAHAVLRVWYDSEDDLDTAALRLALLVPGSVSGKAKDLLSGAISGVRKRAVQMMAMGLIQRFIRWCFRPAGALTN